MIRRTLMRRAYNSGRWERARHYAYQLIANPKEQQLARSVIIRSYWNEGDYEKVVQLNEEWDREFDELLQQLQTVRTRMESQRIHQEFNLAYINQPSSTWISIQRLETISFRRV